MKIKSLHIYPVKATHAADVTEATLEARGFAGDRRWMLVDAGGKFITQRECPKLAQVQAEITKVGLTVSAPGMNSLDIKTPDGNAASVAIWGKETGAHAAAPAADEWFSKFLGISCHIVWQGDNVRPVSEAWSEPGDETSFADGFPLLITVTGSLNDLNSRMDTAVSMNRFRPNIVIEYDEPWREDEWKTLKIGDVEIELSKPCARCVVTTTDQETGARDGKEPLATLAKFRMAAEDRIKGAIFGQNGIPRKTGVIRVGDEVTVVARKTAPVFRTAKKLPTNGHE